MKKKIDIRVIIVGILCITFLESIALMKGINGILLTTVIGVIAASVGITIDRDIILKK